MSAGVSAEESSQSQTCSSLAGEDDDEDRPELSAHALAALQEFYAEQQAALEDGGATSISEDWVRNPEQITNTEQSTCAVLPCLATQPVLVR